MFNLRKSRQRNSQKKNAKPRELIPFLFLIIATFWGLIGVGILLFVTIENKEILITSCFGLATMLYGVSAAFYQPSVNVSMSNPQFKFLQNKEKQDIIQQIKDKLF